MEYFFAIAPVQEVNMLLLLSSLVLASDEHNHADDHSDHAHVSGPWSVGLHGHGHIETPESEDDDHSHVTLRIAACNTWVCAGPTLSAEGPGVFAEAHGHSEELAWMAGVAWEPSSHFGHIDTEIGIGFHISEGMSIGPTAAWIADGIDPFTQSATQQFTGVGLIAFIEAPPIIDIHLSALLGQEMTAEATETTALFGGGIAIRF